MQDQPTTANAFEPTPFATRECTIRLIGGTIVGKFKWYLRLIGLIALGLFASIIAGVALGFATNSGDIGVLTATLLFIAGVAVSLIYVRRQVRRHATLRLGLNGVNVKIGARVLADWSFTDIGRMHCESMTSSQGFYKLTLERGNETIVFEMYGELASQLLEIGKTESNNTVLTGPHLKTYVPNDSENPDQIWRTKLRAEYRGALSEIAFGIFGCAFLCLFAYGILSGQRPKGRLGLIVLMIISALLGPFLLYSGAKGLLNYFYRRRRFANLSKLNQHDAINELITELYGEPES